jgi:hypothetical protein
VIRLADLAHVTAHSHISDGSMEGLLMAMNWKHAYNHWRKTLVSLSNGSFGNDHFDKWFNAGSESPIEWSPWKGVYKAGSKEHFFNVMHQAFKEMVRACAESNLDGPVPIRPKGRRSPPK